MEPPSAPPRRGRGPWQGLLLAASLLTLWSPPTTAQLAVESEPFNVAEGKDVLLAYNLPDSLKEFSWYKGDRVDKDQLIGLYVIATHANNPGPTYHHRETIYPNGSLLFQNVTREDTGWYTLQTINTDLETVNISGWLHVYPELSKPFIISSSSQAVEGEDSVALTCAPETQDTAYLWWINGQSVLDGGRLQLSHNNRTLTVLGVTRNDTGPYECGTQNPVSAGRSDPVSLNVSYGPDFPIIFPLGSHFRVGTNLSLSCLSASNPPAQYSWLINGRPQQAARELFIPNLTTNHSGSYTCRAYSSVTGLSWTIVKIITVSAGQNTPGLLAGDISGIVIGVLFGVSLVSTLGYYLIRTWTGRADVQHGPREPQSMASTPGHGPSGGCTALDSLPGHKTAFSNSKKSHGFKMDSDFHIKLKIAWISTVSCKCVDAESDL